MLVSGPCGIFTAFVILSGVLQGCPLSASLFVICLNPFLALIDSKLSEGEFIAACCDDLLTVTKSEESLHMLAQCFKFLASVAGLHLSVHKTCFIPLYRSPSLHALEMFRLWICKSVPFFANVNIAFSCRYLGVNIGPHAGRSA